MEPPRQDQGCEDKPIRKRHRLTVQPGKNASRSHLASGIHPESGRDEYINIAIL
jgi:hypothetical protein